MLRQVRFQAEQRLQYHLGAFEHNSGIDTSGSFARILCNFENKLWLIAGPALLKPLKIALM